MSNPNLNRRQREAARRRNEETQASLREQIVSEAAQRRVRNAEHAAAEAARAAESAETVLKASDPASKATLLDTRKQLRSR